MNSAAARRFGRGHEFWLLVATASRAAPSFATGGFPTSQDLLDLGRFPTVAIWRALIVGVSALGVILR